MNKTLAALVLGIGALGAGCTDKRDVSEVNSDFIVLARPAGCENPEDIRYDKRGDTASDITYQIRCVQDGGLVLYSRTADESKWTSITVK